MGSPVMRREKKIEINQNVESLRLSNLDVKEVVSEGERRQSWIDGHHKLHLRFRCLGHFVEKASSEYPGGIAY